MRTVVAIVEARPETIAEDYRRLLDLAGFPEEAPASGPVTLAAQVAPGGWFPGTGSPPWQLDAVLDRLGKNPDVEVVPVDPVRGPTGAEGWGWDDSLARYGTRLVGEEFVSGRPWRPAEHLPGLAAAAGGNLEIPAGLTEPGVLNLLAVPSLDPHWAVAGATRLLLSLVPGVRRRPRNLPRESFIAEMLVVAREVLASRSSEVESPGAFPAAPFSILDGVVWEVGAGLPGRGPVTRNVLIAGADPVAVDTVATRMSGVDPGRVPWLKTVRERGLGAADLADIRLVGQTDLVDREFERPENERGGVGVRWPWLDDLSWRMTRRRAILRRHHATPWGRLFADYRNADNRGEGR